MKRKITTKDVAEMLGIDAHFLRHLVEEEKVDFGICTKSGKSKRRSFVYFPEKLKAVVGEDAVNRVIGGKHEKLQDIQTADINAVRRTTQN